MHFVVTGKDSTQSPSMISGESVFGSLMATHMRLRFVTIIDIGRFK